MLAHRLHMQERNLKARAAPTSRIGRLFHRMHFAPIIWIASLAAIGAFHMKVLSSGPTLPQPLPWMSFWAMIASLLSIWGLVLMAVLNLSDPGYIPKRGEVGRHSKGKAESKQGLLQGLNNIENLDCPALWNGHWEQLCVSCKIVRPLRAKHDECSGRCIEVRRCLELGPDWPAQFQSGLLALNE
jgi:palmitoyltransferase ZDHHC13/17